MASTEPIPRRYDFHCQVDAYRHGWTLARFLTHRFRYHPARVWVERIAAGAVRINGLTAAPDSPLARGDRVEYTIIHAEPPVDFSYEILYEDEHVLAVAKSGNLPIHAGGKFIRNTLISRLRESWGDELRPAHRLDRETSGVVLLAKSREVAGALERQFRERRVRKEYVAIVRGEAPLNLVVDAAIARLEPPRPPYRRVVSDGGRQAITRFERLAVGRSRGVAPTPVSLLRVLPESGRTNQIRVHAAHSGHPILGDKIYGVAEEVAIEFVERGETEQVLAAAGAPRHLLHCLSLELRHPRGDGLLELRAALPADFSECWSGPFPELDS